MVQPDTRTYQETEIHVLFDKAQEIKDNDGEEVYENEEAKDIKEKKRTPSPSIRQSCPVLPTHQNNQKHCVKFMQWEDLTCSYQGIFSASLVQVYSEDPIIFY